VQQKATFRSPFVFLLPGTLSARKRLIMKIANRR
jgi:hypothetical protein